MIHAGLADPDVLREVGARLRAYRLRQDVSLRELAAQAGIAPLTLQKAERGHNFTFDTLVRVLRALGRVEQLDAFLPPPPVSPLALLAAQRQPVKRRAGRKPRRG